MDEDFNKLLNDITENPELVLTSQLTDEQILEIQKRINPYSHVTSARDQTGTYKKVAVVSYTNLREDYIRRFVMTSMVGFLYRVMQEYDVPVESRRWTPKKAVSDEDPFKLPDLVERLEAVLDLAKKGLTAETQSEQDDYLFGVTNVLYMLGEESKMRMPSTLEKANASGSPITKELMEQFPDKVKRLASTSSIEMPPALAKGILTQFVDTLFKYDPNIHVKSAKGNVAETNESSEDLIDSDRVTLDQLLMKASKDLKSSNINTTKVLETIFASKVNYNAASAVLTNKSLLDAVQYMAQRPDIYEKHLKYHLDPEVKSIIEVIPPQDTFHRWGYYTEVNYEDIRKATQAIYFDKPDLEWALALLDQFEGSQSEIDNKFESYKTRFQDEMLTDIKLIEFGGWTLLGDFKENRKNMDFYNKNMGILKRIIDRHTEDKQIGKELMKNRVKISKAKNIAEYGPDAPGLKDYKSTMGTNMEAFGAQKAITKEEMKRLEAAKGNLKVAAELEYIDGLRKIVKELEDRVGTDNDLTTEEKDLLEVKKKELVRAVELLDVPDEAIQVDVFTNDGSDLKKTSFYTKSDETLEKEHNDRLALGDSPAPAAPTTVQQDPKKFLGPDGKELDITSLAPFARAFYENASGAQDLQKMEYVEEVVVKDDGVEESKGELHEL
jgi:hypothetical protein